MLTKRNPITILLTHVSDEEQQKVMLANQLRLLPLEQQIDARRRVTCKKLKLQNTSC